MIALDLLLEHLRDNLDAAVRDSDAEGVHQVRVATRRIASWLELAGRRALRDDLRWLRRRAGALRDLDVLLARGDTPVGLRRRWITARIRAHQELSVAAKSARVAGLLGSLSILPPISTPQARERIPIIREMVLRRGEQFCDEPANMEALHRLRRGARRLRYALEWVGDDVKPLRRLQDVLGAANDAVVALAHVDKEGDSPESKGFREKMVGRLSEEIDGVLKEWGIHRPWIERAGGV
jgi:CHAD domain-containing protein